MTFAPDPDKYTDAQLADAILQRRLSLGADEENETVIFVFLGTLNGTTYWIKRETIIYESDRAVLDTQRHMKDVASSLKQVQDVIAALSK